jgi:hypothetical protein
MNVAVAAEVVIATSAANLDILQENARKMKITTEIEIYLMSLFDM